jgi:hypothetical protein
MQKEKQKKGNRIGLKTLQNVKKWNKMVSGVRASDVTVTCALGHIWGFRLNPKRLQVDVRVI